MFRLFARLVVLGLLSLVAAAHAQTLAAIRASHHLDCGVVQGVDDWNGEDVHGNLSGLGGEICRAVAVAVLGDSERTVRSQLPRRAGGLGRVEGREDSTRRRHLAVGDRRRAIRGRFWAACVLRFATHSGRQAKRHRRSRRPARPSRLRARHEPARADIARRIDGAGTSRFALSPIPSRASWTRPSPCDDAWGPAWNRALRSRAPISMRARATSSSCPKGWLSLPSFPPTRQGSRLRADRRLDDQRADRGGGARHHQRQCGRSRKTRRHAGRPSFSATTSPPAQALGLAHDWAAKVIAATGNYGEIFARTTGEPYQLERGLNALWTQGGLMAPMPMR